MPQLSIIIPCYYNEKNLPFTVKALLDNEVNFPDEIAIEYVMIDDGSKDNTLSELLKFKQQAGDRVKVVKLTKNVGAYNALRAGMTCASGDCHIIISADLQDPISLMPQMIKHWLNGYKLVIAHRKERNEPNVQKLFSYFFHLMMRKIVGNAPKGGFDYVLFDNSIKEVLLNLKEKDNSIFYMMTWLGYEYVSIPYTREARSIGESRWTLKKKVGLVIDSVLLFSPFPLRLIIFLGVVLGLVAILSSLCMLFNYLNGNPPDSWIIAVLVGLIIGAAQLISIGVIGEYLWHTLETVRNRPSSVIEKIY